MAVVRTTRKAERRIAEAAEWWWENRKAAPDLFVRELVEAAVKLSVSPGLGVAFPHPRIPGMRKLLMRRTRYHIYYRYWRERDEVQILSVWSTVRGRPPRLS